MHTHTYIYTKVSGSGERLRSRISSLENFQCSGCLELLKIVKIAQGAPRAAQSCSESLRARPEPLRVAQRGRSELFEEPLRVTQSRSESPRAVAQGRPELLRLKNRSESLGVCPEPLRVAQSCSKNQSGSSVLHALCISDAQFYFTWFPLLRACICTGSG